MYIEGLHHKGDEASKVLLKMIAGSKSARDGCLFRGGFEHWTHVAVATRASGAPFYIDHRGPLAPPPRGTSPFWSACLWYVCQSLVCEEREADLPYLGDVKNSYHVWPRVVVPLAEPSPALNTLTWGEAFQSVRRGGGCGNGGRDGSCLWPLEAGSFCTNDQLNHFSRFSSFLPLSPSWSLRPDIRECTPFS